MTRSRPTGRRDRIRRNGTVGAALAAAILVTAAWSSPLQSAEPVKLMDPISGEMVPLPAGEQMTHLCFFATWCRTCMDELPQLIDLEARWKIDGYSLVLIAVPTRQTPERLLAFIRDHQPPGQVLLDAGGELVRRLGVEDLPLHVLLDGKGKVVHETPVLDREVASVIEKLVRNRRE